MKNTLAPAFASAILALSGLASAPAQAAGSIVTYVSGKGADSGSCTPQSSPCRSFAYALTQTLPGGEIKALDPDGYGPVNINQAVSLVGVVGASINRASAGAHITISAPTSASVTIANLILDGGGAATNGILFNTGGNLTINNCVAQNFHGAGIYLWSSTPAAILLTDVVVSDNVGDGIDIASPTAEVAAPTVVLDHVRATNNFGNGVSIFLESVSAYLFVTAVDSVAANNSMPASMWRPGRPCGLRSRRSCRIIKTGWYATEHARALATTPFTAIAAPTLSGRSPTSARDDEPPLSLVRRRGGGGARRRRLLAKLWRGRGFQFGFGSL